MIIITGFSSTTQVLQCGLAGKKVPDVPVKEKRINNVVFRECGKYPSFLSEYRTHVPGW